MEIKPTHNVGAGENTSVIYRDIDAEEELTGKSVQAVHAFCFCGEKLVIVHDDHKNRWTPPGGRVEVGESISEAVCREVQEESNMRVIKQRLVGYQEITEPSGAVVVQVRVVCLVEPYGKFVGDPDGDIDRITLIDPQEYKQYFDWGAVGERVISRAIKLSAKMMVGE